MTSDHDHAHAHEPHAHEPHAHDREPSSNSWKPERREAGRRSRPPREAPPQGTADLVRAVTSVSASFLPSRDAQIRSLRASIDSLAQVVQKQQREIDQLKENRNLVVVEELPRDVVRERVLEFYKKHAAAELYPSDVAESLGLDARTVFEVTEELTADGLLS